MADESSSPTPSTTGDAPATPDATGATLLTQGETTPVTPTDTTVEAKPADKPVDDKVVPDAPEKYELKAPEGMELDSGAIDVLTPIFKDLKLPNEAVQKIADAYGKHLQASAKAQDEKFATWLKTETANNITQLKTELGSKFDTEVRTAQRAIGRFADASVKQVLDETGLGSHPGVVKMFAKIGAMIREDQPPSVPGQIPSDRKSTASLLYGKPN